MALVLTRGDVASLLTLDDCIAAVEDAFRRAGTGEARPAGILGFPVAGGGFHVKAAALGDRFAAKVNGNFSANPALGLPAIQGAILLSDSGNGRLLAVLDSIEITILRTGAATAVAAKYLARPNSQVATICGCGNQGRVQLRALARVLPLQQAFVYDIEPSRAAALACELSGELRIEPVSDLAQAVARSDVCVTCTPSRKPVLHELRPGIFVAAVGADSPDKQELHPALLASAKVVVDSLDQCAEIGELHHVIDAGSMRREDVHAELGDIVAGRKRGRTDDEEITVFDSTGTALQDVAAASSVYAAAIRLRRGIEIEL
ncbi:MAG: ornithine cyclodeaminase family protein [Myxococcales bacterium]